MSNDTDRHAEEIRDEDLDQASGGYTATDDLWELKKTKTTQKSPDGAVVSGPIPLPVDKG